jgi:hypothetical protein
MADDLFPDSPLVVSIDNQIDEVRLEIRYRQRVYRRLIDQGKMSESLASRKVAVMRAVLATLEKLKARG